MVLYEPDLKEGLSIPTEKEPIRRCTNKRFIRKVMFLVVVAKPRQDHGRKVLFDGKLGCCTLTEVSP